MALEVELVDAPEDGNDVEREEVDTPPLPFLRVPVPVLFVKPAEVDGCRTVLVAGLLS